MPETHHYPTCRNTTCRTTAEFGYADRGLCHSCEQRGTVACKELPGLWFDLVPLVREKPVTGVSATGGTFGPSVPLNLHADALVREIEYVTGMWAEIVRDRARLNGANGNVLDRCRTLTTHWPVLISVRAWPVVLSDHTIVDLDGVDGILDLIHLHARGTAAVGQTVQVLDLPGICPNCRRPTLRHRDTADDMWCATCYQVWPWNEYAAHVDLLTAAGRP